MSSIFGGGTSKASRQSVANQQAANADTQRFIEQQAGQARQDALNLIPQGQQAQAQGMQAALELLTGSLNPQIQAMQQGNVKAQRALGQGMGQFQNAILGTPLNMQAFQPQMVNYDLSAFQGLTVPGYQEPTQNVGTVDNSMPQFGTFPAGGLSGRAGSDGGAPFGIDRGGRFSVDGLFGRGLY